MELDIEDGARADEIPAFFAAVFTASEGEAEGQRIGDLATALLATTPKEDRLVFSARENGELLGCVVFSRLVYEQEDRIVFLLSPVAVASRRQNQGIGQALVQYGLDALRRRGVDVAVTYGDPDYYARVGFRPVSKEVARAPLPLSHPEGWLAQSLTDLPLAPLKGPSRCVVALNDPDYW